MFLFRIKHQPQIYFFSCLPNFHATNLISFSKYIIREDKKHKQKYKNKSGTHSYNEKSR
jgi:hypothetical protein